MPAILAAAVPDLLLADAATAVAAPALMEGIGAGVGALGSMTGGMELAGLTNAAAPAMFNPATVGGLAQSMQLANGIGLPGLMQGAGLNAGMVGSPVFGMPGFDPSVMGGVPEDVVAHIKGDEVQALALRSIFSGLICS